MSFPDVEDALCELLDDIAPTYTVTDKTLEAPVIVINRTGGHQPIPGLFDLARVEIQCFAASRADSRELNKSVRDRLSGSRLVQTTAGLLDAIDEDQSPTPFPYGLEQDNVRREISSWVVSTRST